MAQLQAVIRPPHIYSIRLRDNTMEDVRVGSEVHRYLGLSRGVLYRDRNLNWTRVEEAEAEQLIAQGALGHVRERGKIIPARDLLHLLPLNVHRFAPAPAPAPAPAQLQAPAVNTTKKMMFVVCGIIAIALGLSQLL